MKDADGKRGELLFKHPKGAGCVKCHGWIEGTMCIGPGLAGMGSRSTLKHIVQSIVEPNAVITEGFQQQSIMTNESQVYSGILIEESGLSVTLGLSSGELVTIPKSTIDNRKSGAVSAMPNVLSVIDATQIADIAVFLQSLKSKD